MNSNAQTQIINATGNVVSRGRKVIFSINKRTGERKLVKYVGFGYFPEDVWTLIKSYMGFGQHKCFYKFTHMTQPRLLRIPTFVRMSYNVLDCRVRTGDGIYDIHYDASKGVVKYDYGIKWVCEHCIARTHLDEAHGKYKTEYSAYDLQDIQKFRIDTDRKEREAKYFAKHGHGEDVAEHLKIVKGAKNMGNKHARFVQKNRESMSVEDNLKDLEKYWKPFVEKTKRDVEHHRVLMAEECASINRDIERQASFARHLETPEVREQVRLAREATRRKWLAENAHRI